MVNRPRLDGHDPPLVVRSLPACLSFLSGCLCGQVITEKRSGEETTTEVWIVDQESKIGGG